MPRQGRRKTGIFSLTVPTAGKTLSGMAFALAHIAKPEHQLRRFIVIEHHSAIKIADDTDETRPYPPFEKHAAEYVAENWDAPIIVTTSVQFIESLFGCRTSRCRKLHNIAHSVIIFDEVQTLPSHLLNPLLNVFRNLRDNYGVSFVFSTATQPAFRHRPLSLSHGFKPDEIQEITQDTSHLFDSLRRVTIRTPKANETTSWDKLASDMSEHKQALCIVNVRNDAFGLWEKLRSQVSAEEKASIFHLSSAMCAEHRLAILGTDRDPQPGTIRYRLIYKQTCRLVSTQLIEAGVDVGFPIVWRALGL
ncbi:MAG: hypothetical protein PHG00_16530 [Methylococcales bacterium]|nr:hypothetical protein [Methylococcales bacterium]